MYYKLTKLKTMRLPLHLKFILRFATTFVLLPFVGLSQNEVKISTLIENCEKAMGGQKAYNSTRHITWNFFGVRTLYWDKYTGDVRIEVPKDEKVLLWNANTGLGKAQVKGQSISDSEELTKLMEQAKSIWINDSYWLVMPFKLNDPGVAKKCLGEMKTLNDVTAEVIEITFTEVGLTPDNKYHVYFDPNTRLVTQWDFYRAYSDEKPAFSMPWQNYEQYGKIMLSGDRGERKLSNIKVFKKLPSTVYQSFDNVNI